MDEDFIFQVTEEELAQFPEEEGIEKEQKRKEQKPCRTSPEERRRRKYFAEGKSKYPFPVGLETTQVVCYQQKWPV